MALIPGSIPVTGFIGPTDSLDTYAVTDAIYGIDGFRSVSAITVRNLITTERRREGMLVYTQNDQNVWQLLPSPWVGTNADWKLFISSAATNSLTATTSFLSLSGGTVSGDTQFLTNLSAGSLFINSTGVIFSAGTDLYNIFLTTSQSGGTGGFSGWTSSTGSNSIILNNSTNLASGSFALAGGYMNSATTKYTSVVGGFKNKVSGYASFIGGGTGNTILGIFSVMGGGYRNTATTATFTTMAGGYLNLISADRTFIGGGAYNVASGNYASVVGGSANLATYHGAFIGGGRSNRSSGDFSVVGGGYLNLASGYRASVLGGMLNSAATPYSVAVGGKSNLALGSYSVIGGGKLNLSTSPNSFIGSGRFNSAMTYSYASIVGGQLNKASGTGSFIGGGSSNSALTIYSVVVGGQNNLASGINSAILNGLNNKISGDRSAVIGGTFINGTANDTVYVPNFNIQSATTNNTFNSVLVRNTNGDIYLRDASSLSGGTSATTITASNGLTKSVDNITLGGSLTGNTYIDNAGFLLRSNTFSATTMSAQTIHVSNISGFSPINLYNIASLDASVENIWDTAYSGSIIMKSGTSISSNNGGGQIDLDWAIAQNYVAITSDNGNGAYSLVEVGNDYTGISNAGNSGGTQSYMMGAEFLYDSIGGLNNVSNFWSTGLKSMVNIGVALAYDPNYEIYQDISIIQNASNAASVATGIRDAIFIGANNSTINAGVKNTVVMAGSAITATQSNSVYMSNARLAETTGSAIFSAGTNLYNIFATTSMSGGTTSGNFLPLSGGTVTGNTIFTSGVTANTLTITSSSNEVPLNVPIFTSDPVSPINGDVWITSGVTGNAFFRIRIGGLTKTVEMTG
jgi:hypothetical protein